MPKMTEEEYDIGLQISMLRDDREYCIEACCNPMVSAKEKKRLKALRVKLEKLADKLTKQLYGA